METTTIDMLQAKSTLSKLVADLEAGVVAEVIIARNGRPAARLLPFATPASDRSRRTGVTRRRFEVPGGRSDTDDDVLRLFEGDGHAPAASYPHCAVGRNRQRTAAPPGRDSHPGSRRSVCQRLVVGFRMESHRMESSDEVRSLLAPIRQSVEAQETAWPQRLQYPSPGQKRNLTARPELLAKTLPSNSHASRAQHP